MSRKESITASPRFTFNVPETVYEDLTHCYAHAVRVSETEMRLTAETERILQAAAGWMQKGKRGLLLCGNCGTGKTKLMQALSNLFAYYLCDRNKLHVYSAAEIVRMSVSKDEQEMVIYGGMKKWNYLGIDDLGTEPVSVKNWGTESSPLIDLIYQRYNNMRVTVLSTNNNMEMIRNVYGERIFDRICEQYDRIVFNFQSFRQSI